MKKVLLYFVMLLCLVFIFLPPILRLTYKDPSEETAIKENGALICKKVNPSEMIRVVYANNTISMFLYEFNENSASVKELKDYFDDNRYTTRNYQEDESIQAYIQYANHAEEITKLPSVYQKNYMEVEKELKKYSFTCNYQKM